MPFDMEEAVGPQLFFARKNMAQLAHAYLFSGSAGIGKKRFARLLAQALLCEGEKTQLLDYDGSCSSCRRFLAGTHPDFFSHEGEIKIGDREGGRASEELTARELVRQLSLHAYGSARRVLLLGDVAFATHHAANALLKFFEEPPRGVVLLLTTSQPGSLIGTIRSRMVEVPFSPLSQKTVTRILTSDGVAEADAARVAALAQGSVTRARGLLEEQGLREHVTSWFFEAAAGRSADAAWANRAILPEALELIALLVRDWGVAVVGGGNQLSGESLRLRNLPLVNDAVVQVLGAVADAQRVARTNVSAGLVVEGLRLAIAQACVVSSATKNSAR